MISEMAQRDHEMVDRLFTPDPAPCTEPGHLELKLPAEACRSLLSLRALPSPSQASCGCRIKHSTWLLCRKRQGGCSREWEENPVFQWELLESCNQCDVRRLNRCFALAGLNTRLSWTSLAEFVGRRLAFSYETKEIKFNSILKQAVEGARTLDNR